MVYDITLDDEVASDETSEKTSEISPALLQDVLAKTKVRGLDYPGLVLDNMSPEEEIHPVAGDKVLDNLRKMNRLGIIGHDDVAEQEIAAEKKSEKSKSAKTEGGAEATSEEAQLTPEQQHHAALLEAINHQVMIDVHPAEDDVAQVLADERSNVSDRALDYDLAKLKMDTGISEPDVVLDNTAPDIGPGDVHPDSCPDARTDEAKLAAQVLPAFISLLAKKS